MSKSHTDPIAVTIEKAKVGPITKRYRGGEFRTIDRERDGKKRMAICDLDNSHNGDYKVAYASDPLIVIQANSPDVTHEQLRTVLERHNIWNDELTPIEIPTRESRWKAGFKSLPRAATQIDHLIAKMKNAVEREMDYLGSETGGTAYLRA